MKVAIVTAVHGRLPVTRVWWKGMDRIVALWENLGIETQVYMAGSESDQQELCESHGGQWVQAENQPLGLKWNTALRAVSRDTDYIFITGDDDFYSPELMKHYAAHIILGTPYVAVHGLYFYEPATQRAMQFLGYNTRIPQATHPYIPEIEPKLVDDFYALRSKDGSAKYTRLKKKPLTRVKYSVGAGRLLHSSLVEQCSWQLWHDDIPRGLDGSMNIRLGPLQAHLIPCSPSRFVLDVKTGTNLWSYDRLLKYNEGINASWATAQPETFTTLPEWADICALA